MSAVAAKANVTAAGHHAVSAWKLARHVSTKINVLITPSSFENFTPDMPHGSLTTSTSFDAASVHIIDRLDSLERHLEERPGNIPRSHSSAQPMLIQYPVMESILEWPVFESLTSLRKGQSLAITDSDSAGHNPSPGNPAEQNPENREVEHDFDIEYAIHMFLQNVHSKNPILDSRVLAEAVCRCSANGFDTSRESALVIIACALGLRSSPFVPSRNTQHVPQDTSNDQAEHLFRRGNQILALQPPSLLATQCRFFCGVYEMFCIRPVAAWLHFSQASLQLKLYIHSRTFSYPLHPSVDSGLLQRLYWSFRMHNISELSNELRTTTVGLDQLAFPYAFPQPPAQNESSTALDSGGNAGQLKNWMYYLSETSLRRVGSEIISTMYSKEPGNWKEDIPEVTNVPDWLTELQGWITCPVSYKSLCRSLNRQMSWGYTFEADISSIVPGLFGLCSTS
ncbi:uncharacterized protein FFUJ_12049 [Fusarium fujikuroi IMI 58289]|uniref:Xylanolytic transcriptional activator regulatory domain-containing protein n=1 Tax=Gibberella fujikuroi (strain CBS 195.34 / IMI 58289 / NRRL A-6831) TaxID=1279085 RepID=S0EN69_GIBF5|nr:LOW QUALITY PROTEIN: uncharacterized protein FFUJ_12049 [Fusarium fujikuroi IMI 58289]CCT76102.1 uncharacterized protein FFUJ_12049 [Fusarium fujikuroi IMI 58289]